MSTKQTTLEIVVGDDSPPEPEEDEKACPNCGWPFHKNRWPQHVKQCSPDESGGADSR